MQQNKALNEFIKNKMVEIVRAVKTVDPEADYILLAFVDGNTIQFNNDYFEKEDPDALKIEISYYTEEFAFNEFGALNPTLEGIDLFTI